MTNDSSLTIIKVNLNCFNKYPSCYNLSIINFILVSMLGFFLFYINYKFEYICSIYASIFLLLYLCWKHVFLKFYFYMFINLDMYTLFLFLKYFFLCFVCSNYNKLNIFTQNIIQHTLNYKDFSFNLQ
jgi:hypothetical protein